MRMSSLSDVDFDRLGQRETGAIDQKLAAMSADAAVDAARKMLLRRRHQCTICFNNNNLSDSYSASMCLKT